MTIESQREPKSLFAELMDTIMNYFADIFDIDVNRLRSTLLSDLFYEVHGYIQNQTEIDANGISLSIPKDNITDWVFELGSLDPQENHSFFDGFLEYYLFYFHILF